MSQARIKELENLLRKFKIAYDTTGTPLVADEVYDQLEAELRNLDPQNPVLKVVGYKLKKDKILKQLKKTPTGDLIHDPPMLSADKVYTAEEVVKWAAGDVIVWGFKVDGLSLELIYNLGKLISASTRGNGIKGENKTQHAFFLKDIPEVLPQKINCVVRGEAYEPASEFERVNAELAAKGFEQLKSPRCVASGAINSEVPSEAKQRGMRFMTWDFIMPGKQFTVIETIQIVRDLGFISANQGVIDTRAIPDLFQKVTAARDRYDFDLDGLIFKINDPDRQKLRGVNNKFPRWIMALKFEPEVAVTKLLSISWQISPKGRITPVANLEPIPILGANIEHANLLHARFVLDNQIAPGDSLVIERSGDVIPNVQQVIKTTNFPAVIPSQCPECGGKTEFIGDKFLYCTNPNCNETKFQTALHFVEAVNIEGLGPSTLRAMWDTGAIKHAADLFKLSEQYMTNTFGKNGVKIYNLLQNLKMLPFDLLLAALNVPYLGKTSARKLASKYNSCDELTPQAIQAVLGTGKISGYVIKGLASKPWKPFLAAGVKVKKGEVRSIKSTNVSGG
jgi:DNA ligase (NAD+)